MTSRRVVPLTGDLLEEFGAPCGSCLFWERGELRPEDRASRDPTDPEDAVRKQAWASARLQEGWAPGRAVRLEGSLAAWVTFAPAGVFAPLPPPSPRVSPDALQVATLYVQPHLRGHGLGRLLLQAAVREALTADLAAVEVHGDRRWRERACLLPVTWLLREGFEVHREAPRRPLLRLDVRRTLRWAPSLESALEEVLGRLPRPARVPEGIARSAPVPGGDAEGEP
jgi:GNAT superfamily N-acetyltransferase